MKCIFVFLIIPLLALAGTSKKVVKNYTFHSKYDYSSVSLYGDYTFKQTQRSCTYAFNSSGTWEMKGDTILLHHQKIKHKIGQNNVHVDRTNKLISIGQDSLQFLWHKDFGLNHILALQPN